MSFPQPRSRDNFPRLNTPDNPAIYDNNEPSTNVIDLYISKARHHNLEDNLEAIDIFNANKAMFDNVVRTEEFISSTKLLASRMKHVIVFVNFSDLEKYLGPIFECKSVHFYVINRQEGEFPYYFLNNYIMSERIKYMIMRFDNEKISLDELRDSLRRLKEVSEFNFFLPIDPEGNYALDFCTTEGSFNLIFNEFMLVEDEEISPLQKTAALDHSKNTYRKKLQNIGALSNMAENVQIESPP